MHTNDYGNVAETPQEIFELITKSGLKFTALSSPTLD